MRWLQIGVIPVMFFAAAHISDSKVVFAAHCDPAIIPKATVTWKGVHVTSLVFAPHEDILAAGGGVEGSHAIVRQFGLLSLLLKAEKRVDGVEGALLSYSVSGRLLAVDSLLPPRGNNTAFDEQQLIQTYRRRITVFKTNPLVEERAESVDFDATRSSVLGFV